MVNWASSWRGLTPVPGRKAAKVPVADGLEFAPSEWARERLGFVADPVQRAVLDSHEKSVLICCSRQWGKTVVTGVRALHRAVTVPGSLVVCVTPSERQSAIWMSVVEGFAGRLGLPMRRDRRESNSLVLPNGSSIVGLPASERTIRGFSGVSFLVLDEAAYVPDQVYHAVRPFLATTNGWLWMVSTPNGQSGFFYESWHRARAGWRKFSVPATECARISREFLDSERARMGPLQFGQEYLCQFQASSAQWISREMVESAITGEEPHPAEPPKVVKLNRPMQTARPSSRLFLGLDLGFSQDRTALAIVEEMTRPTGEYDYAEQQDLVETVLVLRHVEAYPLKTPYREVAGVVERALTGFGRMERRELAVDATGVGLPVIEMLREARLGVELRPITLTAGEAVGGGAMGTTVPRHVLLHHLRRMFEMKELRIPANVPGIDLLMEELVGLGNERAGVHDDLAFALALALWVARPGGYVGERRELLPGAPGGDNDAALRYAEAEMRRRRLVG